MYSVWVRGSFRIGTKATSSPLYIKVYCIVLYYIVLYYIILYDSTLHGFPCFRACRGPREAPDGSRGRPRLDQNMIMYVSVYVVM